MQRVLDGKVTTGELARQAEARWKRNDASKCLQQALAEAAHLNREEYWTYIAIAEAYAAMGDREGCISAANMAKLRTQSWLVEINYYARAAAALAIVNDFKAAVQTVMEYRPGNTQDLEWSVLNHAARLLVIQGKVDLAVDLIDKFPEIRGRLNGFTAVANQCYRLGDLENYSRLIHRAWFIADGSFRPMRDGEAAIADYTRAADLAKLRQLADAEKYVQFAAGRDLSLEHPNVQEDVRTRRNDALFAIIRAKTLDGNFKGAVHSANLIRDPKLKAQAIGTIIGQMARQDQREQAERLSNRSKPLERAWAATELAMALHEAGQDAQAMEHVLTAREAWAQCPRYERYTLSVALFRHLVKLRDAHALTLAKDMTVDMIWGADGVEDGCALVRATCRMGNDSLAVQLATEVLGQVGATEDGFLVLCEEQLAQDRWDDARATFGRILHPRTRADALVHMGTYYNISMPASANADDWVYTLPTPCDRAHAYVGLALGAMQGKAGARDSAVRAD